MEIPAKATRAAHVAVGVLWVRRQRLLADPMIDVALFGIRAFNAALAVNFLAIFVMIGYFLFVAQYLQLVLGRSPLVAGLWSLPSAVAFVAASQVTPWLARRVPTARLVAGGLAVAMAGLALLLGVGTADGLAALVAPSVVISIGMGPVFGLTTELIVGSAPREKAGAATGVSETAAEVGGALGIAVLGSIGVAVYRGRVDAELPAGVPDHVAAAARDTLGAALDTAYGLPEELRAALVGVTREAFVAGLHLTSLIAAALAAVLAALAAVALREPSPEPADDVPVPCA